LGRRDQKPEEERGEEINEKQKKPPPKREGFWGVKREGRAQRREEASLIGEAPIQKKGKGPCISRKKRERESLALVTKRPAYVKEWWICGKIKRVYTQII